MLLAGAYTKLKGKKLFTACSQNCLPAQVPTSWTVARGKSGRRQRGQPHSKTLSRYSSALIPRNLETNMVLNLEKVEIGSTPFKRIFTLVL